jgi:hypothetical protein
VVLLGIVHARKTLSPRRTARRSSTGVGKCKDGGFGAPGVPHPASRQTISENATRIERIMRGKWKDHTNKPVASDCANCSCLAFVLAFVFSGSWLLATDFF